MKGDQDMTDKTSTLTGDEEAAAKAAGEKLAKTGVAFLVTLAFVALFSWLGGVALSVGFGVHFPFVAGVILLTVGLSVVKMTTAEVASVWHTARVKADVTLIATTMAAQEAIQEQEGAKAFLAMNDRIKDMSSKVDGGYL
jgi:hypothetical protein